MMRLSILREMTIKYWTTLHGEVEPRGHEAIHRTTKAKHFENIFLNLLVLCKSEPFVVDKSEPTSNIMNSTQHSYAGFARQTKNWRKIRSSCLHTLLLPYFSYFCAANDIVMHAKKKQTTTEPNGPVQWANTEEQNNVRSILGISKKRKEWGEKRRK